MPSQKKTKACTEISARPDFVYAKGSGDASEHW